MEFKLPERLPLCHLPTPIEPLPRLSALLKGSELYIKRDDLTGLAEGGNKARKLEYLLAEAQSQGCNHIITSGYSQGNHCRLTAAAASRLGMGCSLVFQGKCQERLTGNLLISKLMGAHLYWAEDEPVSAIINRLVAQQKTIGHRPYVIPAGGSNVVGTAAYVAAMQELIEQMDSQGLNFDVIVLASRSGGTQAGLVLGGHLTGFNGKIFGISIARPGEELKTQIAALLTATATHIGLDTLSLPDKIDVNDDYIGPGYGLLTEIEREAISLLAEKEGILLDPRYTGRAFGGLIDLIRWGAFTRNQTILFWHTGGLPSLYTYPYASLSYP